MIFQDIINGKHAYGLTPKVLENRLILGVWGKRFLYIIVVKVYHWIRRHFCRSVVNFGGLHFFVALCKLVYQSLNIFSVGIN